MLYLVSLQSQSGLLFLIMGVLIACFVLNIFTAGTAARLAAETGWAPRRTLDETLGELLAYWRDAL